MLQEEKWDLQKKSVKEGVQMADAPENVCSQYECSQKSGKGETHRDRAKMKGRHRVRGRGRGRSRKSRSKGTNRKGAKVMRCSWWRHLSGNPLAEIHSCHK